MPELINTTSQGSKVYQYNGIQFWVKNGKIVYTTAPVIVQLESLGLIKYGKVYPNTYADRDIFYIG